MEAQELFAGAFVLVVFSGVFIVYMGLRQRSQQLEMQHRERMAMIERGLTPVAEAAVGPEIRRRLGRGGSGSRSMSLGIVVVAVGLGLMSIVGIAAGAAEVGVGIGGAIVLVGVAFIVRSIVVRGDLPQGPGGTGTDRPDPS